MSTGYTCIWVISKEKLSWTNYLYSRKVITQVEPLIRITLNYPKKKKRITLRKHQHDDIPRSHFQNSNSLGTFKHKVLCGKFLKYGRSNPQLQPYSSEKLPNLRLKQEWQRRTITHQRSFNFLIRK